MSSESAVDDTYETLDTVNTSYSKHQAHYHVHGDPGGSGTAAALTGAKHDAIAKLALQLALGQHALVVLQSNISSIGRPQMAAPELLSTVTQHF